MLLKPGTYRGATEGLTFEFSVECLPTGQLSKVSGDISQGSQFIATLICKNPQVTEEGHTITGPLTFRGNQELFTGSLYLNADARGIGSFQVGVDMEGGFRDLFAGRLDWQGSYLRRLSIELDGIEGTQPPRGYRMRDGTTIMTLERAFQQVGFNVSVVVDSFRGRAPAQMRARGYTEAEIHAAMQQNRNPVPADRLHAHIFVCSYLAGRGNRGVLGIMYDFEQHDINRRPREGVAVFYDHPLLSDPRIPEQIREREYLFTTVHEIGHALNLMHSFDKAKPMALSWMNYPHLYPRGYEAGQSHDGTEEFWRLFEELFDEDELEHLRHATPREIRAGGFAFGVYEEGASTPFGGPAEPRRTRLGVNPLRATSSVLLKAEPNKREYDLGEPVFLCVEVKNVGIEAVRIPDALDPSEGYLRLLIRTPSGQVIRYRPPTRLCKQAQLLRLPPNETMHEQDRKFDHLPLFLSADGPIFTEPGVYHIASELTGVDGSRNVYSQTARLRVRPPDDATEEFAYKLWSKPSVLEALYLRHPLTAREEWNEIEDELARATLPRENTTQSYFNYIAATGWMSEFAPPNAPAKGPDSDKVIERLKKVDPKGLPSAIRRRTKEYLEG